MRHGRFPSPAHHEREESAMHNETHPFEGTIHPWHGGCQRCGHPEDHEIHAVDVMELDLLGGPDEIPPAREPIYDRLTEPPHSVRVCPYCGLEVVGTRVGADPD